MKIGSALWCGLLAGVAVATVMTLPAAAQQQKRPNIVMLMTDDTGWNDFGAYSGGGAARPASMQGRTTVGSVHSSFRS